MMLEQLWQMSAPPTDAFADEFSEYTPLERQLLWNRDLRDKDSIERFFNLSYEENIYDPMAFNAMQDVVDRIRSGVEQDDNILVYGDYDADGVCGASVLTEALKRCGIEAGIYIPDRSTEGHGLGDVAIAYLLKEKVNLVITVDCGITNYDEIKRAKKNGIDVIVTDHHILPDKIPPAYAIINPQDPNSGYPFSGLSGTGVAFKVAQALFRNFLNEEECEHSEKWLLDRVAVATVADMMPLLDENRALVRYGLVVLAQTRCPGLRALMKVARVEPSFDAKTLHTNITAETIGFRIGPRLNAASRMDHANTAFQLLMTDSDEEAMRLADILDKHNRDRQRETERVMKEVEKCINPDASIIVESSSDWPIGLAGLIAGRIANTFWRPVVIIEERKDKSMGSARGIPGFNLIDLFDTCSDLFEDYGGHANAAGFTIKTERIEELRTCLNEHVVRILEEIDTRPRIIIEAELPANDVSFDMIETLSRFEPFGQKNPAPVFLLSEWRITGMRMVGAKGKHLKLRLTKEAEDGIIKGVDAIAFGRGHDDEFYIGSVIDCVGELQANEWNNDVTLQIMVNDLRTSKEEKVSDVRGGELIQAYPVV